MSRSYFTFNGICSADYGIYVTAKNNFLVPQRDYTEIEVPGRNGSIFIDNGRYKNVDITYHCEMPTERWLGFEEAFQEFRGKIAACTGYCELTDTYTPNVKRYGILTSEVVPTDRGAGWIIGEFDLTFSCKPQKFIDDGMRYRILPFITSGFYTANGDIGSVTSGSKYARTTYMYNTEGADILKLRSNSSAKMYISKASTSTGKQTNQQFSLIGEKETSIRLSGDSFGLFWTLSDMAGVEVRAQLDDGEYFFIRQKGVGIKNDYQYDALPKIYMPCDRKTTLHSFVIDGKRFTMTLPDAYTDAIIDSAAQSVYDDEGNGLSAYTKIYTGETSTFAERYPVLNAGKITWIETWDSLNQYEPLNIRIMPNWWTL